jgi:signal transduction histidine kinase
MSQPRRTVPAWIFVGALFVLGGVLGVLQYRWIGEVSRAERERLQATLRAALDGLGRDFDSEIAADCLALLPAGAGPGTEAPDAQVSARYLEWKRTTVHGRIFRRGAIAAAGEGSAYLHMLDLETGAFKEAAWPVEWEYLRGRIEGGLPPEAREGPGPPPPPAPPGDDDLVVELPLAPMRMAPMRMPPMRSGAPPMPFSPPDSARLILELDLDYLRGVLLPEAVERHLGTNGSLDYQVEVVANRDPSVVIYRSDANRSERIEDTADASVGLLEAGPGIAEGGPRSGRGSGRGPEPGRGPGPAPARWRMFVRHRAGSLEALVESARRRNLAVTFGVLLLMVAALAALIRFTRRAQRLADLEMDFVAGVSHELRTPLTVIHTAAYNLRGGLAHSPAQVEQYGALIQKESGRLKEMVEQVLQFAGAKAGRLVGKTEPLSVAAVVDEAIESSRAVVEEARAEVQKGVDRDLPPILGDRAALRRVLENLLANAAKHGSKDPRWIGIFASRAAGGNRAAVEIRVADRGPGIPSGEQKHVFDAFFRGRRAIEEQVHGTGLGLHLAKRIVEAHGGTIRVKSEPGRGTEIVVTLPSVPAETPPAKGVQ